MTAKSSGATSIEQRSFGWTEGRMLPYHTETRSCLWCFTPKSLHPHVADRCWRVGR